MTRRLKYRIAMPFQCISRTFVAILYFTGNNSIFGRDLTDRDRNERATSNAKLTYLIQQSESSRGMN